MSDIKNKISFLKKEKEKILSLDKKPEKQETKKSQSTVVEEDEFFLKNKVEEESAAIITDEEINNKANNYNVSDALIFTIIGFASISIISFIKILFPINLPLEEYDSSFSSKINDVSSAASNMLDFLSYPVFILGMVFIIKGFYLFYKSAQMPPR